MISESHKAGNRKWDKENMKTVSCRMRTEEADNFKKYCEMIHTTPAAYLKKKVREALVEYSKAVYAQEHPDNPCPESE